MSTKGVHPEIRFINSATSHNMQSKSMSSSNGVDEQDDEESEFELSDLDEDFEMGQFREKRIEELKREYVSPFYMYWTSCLKANVHE